MNHKQDITIKTSWDDITINDYFNLKGVTDMIDILSVLTSLPKDTLKQYPIRVINELIKGTEFIHSQIPIKDDIQDDHMKVRVTGGEEVIYRLNLNVGEWESGRFIDFMEFSSDTELINDNMHLLMVICCDLYVKRELKWYEVFKEDQWVKVPRNDRDLLQEAEQALESFPISTTLSFLTFFLDSLENSLTATVDSLEFMKEVMNSMIPMDTMIHQWNLEKQHSTKTSSSSYGLKR